ncbi:MAG TPA: alpha/beta fold hydrolase [Candidatus Polarisedimenticolia bacterium]|nr:alpha/beta fold hydrolase [Candidatus Polarisedimenticolia bacterium]
MSAELLSCVEVEPSARAERTILWLHGLGADGHDFEPIVPYLDLPDELAVRFVFPHAPQRAVTINMGMTMRAWYDVRSPQLHADPDLDGLRAAAGHVRALIARENARGIPTDRIVLAGFSQGGVVALHAALRHPAPVAGVMALSCYLMDEASLEQERAGANNAVSIFQAHGSDDPMVPIQRGIEARDRLLGLGYAVEWRTYPMGHEVHPREIEDIGAWLQRTFAG